MAKITIPSIFGSPTSKKRSKPLQRRSEDALSIASRPTSAPLSKRSTSVRTPPSARLRAQLQHLRPQSTVSRSDSNASSPRVADDESWKRGSKSTKGEEVAGYFGNEKTVDGKGLDTKNERPTLGTPLQGDEKLISSVSDGKSIDGKARRHGRDGGRPAPSSPIHTSEETPELLVVLQEVRRKREAAERKQWLEKWEGFADSLGSNIDLSPGAGKKKSGEEKRKELGKAKSSNLLLERPKVAPRFPGDERSELSERQKAMNRLPIEEQESPFDKGKSSVSLPLSGMKSSATLPLIGEESPLYRKRLNGRATVGEPKGWGTFADEKEDIVWTKRSYTPTERQAALSRLPIEERKKLSGSFDHMIQPGDVTTDTNGAKAVIAKANEKRRITTPVQDSAHDLAHEGDTPSKIYFSPKTLRTYVTLSPPTKTRFELSPVPKRSVRTPSTRTQPTPGPRSSSRSFSDIFQSPATKSPSLNFRAVKSRSTSNGRDDARNIPQLAVPEDLVGDLQAEDTVARWQKVREALWYDSDEEDESYAEKMRLIAARSIAGSETAMA